MHGYTDIFFDLSMSLCRGFLEMLLLFNHFNAIPILRPNSWPFVLRSRP